ncbi:MAG: chaperone modulator CbpM [Gammaproteobacteria bacterium]
MNVPSTAKHTLTGLILDEDCIFTLEELSTTCAVHTEYIVELVEEGIVEPREHQREQQHWTFSGKSLLRARKARRLQQDLGINLAGAALVLDMMEEIERLRERIRRLD